MKRVVIIDGNNLFSRGFWISKKKGRDPLEFVIEMYFNLRERNNGARFIFAFDTTKSERRLKLFPEYKANRHSSLTPEEKEIYSTKLQAFVEITKASYHSVLEGEGYEADDYIACVTSMLRNNYEVIIVSMDGDMLQLVGKNTKVNDPVKCVTVDSDNFEQVTEIPRQFFLDYKCIIGDDSDNISGFSGIAEKSAKKFIAEFGSFEKIVEGLSAKDPDKLTKRELEIITNQEIFHRNKLLMDLSLYFTDKTLQEHIKAKVSRTGLDKKLLNEVLSIHDLSHWYRKFLECCSKTS